MKTLKKIADVNWSEKNVASGRATHVPQALADLVSPDEEVRHRAYWRLDNEVVLQSDLFEGAYFVISFLLEFLDDKVAHGRDRIYDLLYEIASGYAPPEVLCHTLEGDTVPLNAACDREVRKGLPLFLRDAADTDAAISDRAKELSDLLAEREQTIDFFAP
jgi:hypothetical protein